MYKWLFIYTIDIIHIFTIRISHYFVYIHILDWMQKQLVNIYVVSTFLLFTHWAISLRQHPIIYSCSRLFVGPLKMYPDVYECATTCVACPIQWINFRVHILYSYHRHRQETNLDILWNMYVIIEVNTLIDVVWWYFTIRFPILFLFCYLLLIS